MVSVPSDNAFDLAFVDHAVSTVSYDGVVRIDRSDGASLFTGTLLYSGRHILTAAHALPTGIPASDYTVTFVDGTTSQSLAVSALARHPQWTGTGVLNYDMAVLTLAAPAPDWADRYALYTDTDEIGKTVIQVGFGTPATGAGGLVNGNADPIRRFGENTYDLLGEQVSQAEAGTFLVYDFDDGSAARDALGTGFNAPDTGRGAREVAASAGDSGGPGLIDGKIAAVTSWGATSSVDADGVSNSSFGEIFLDARVSSMVDFIESVAGRGPTRALSPNDPVADIDSGGFSAAYYLAQNPDVAAAGVDGRTHFLQFGAAEGRDPNPYVDSDAYLAVYGDVAAAGVNPLDHYMLFGWREGRDPSARFDTDAYLAANPDVAAAGVNPLIHFLQFGLTEGRWAYLSDEAAWNAVA